MRAISRDEWVAAAIVGGLRMQANAGRQALRDRGADTNATNELQGAIGEIVCALHVAELFPSEPLECELFHWGSGASRHLKVHTDTSAGEIALEAKCHFHDPGKKLLLINDKAFSNSVERGAHGFVPVMAHAGGEECVVGRLIEISDVAQWKCRTLGAHQDPARQIRLTDAAPRYWDMTIAEAEAVGRGGGTPATKLLELLSGAAKLHDQLESEDFELSTEPARAIDQLVALDNRAWKAR